MITKNQIEYRDHLASEYWERVSGAVKSRAGWRCQVCNSPNNLCAHHRSYDHRGDEMNHLSDLICMCELCHKIFHHVERYGNKAEKVSQKPNLTTIPNQSTKDAATKTRVLNRETVESLKVKGGMTSATLKAIGLDWSFTKRSGWIKSLYGRVVTEEAYQRAIIGKRIRS